MSLSLIFWILMLFALIFGLASYRGFAGAYGVVGNNLLLWFLLFILGWGVFGAPVQG